MGKLIMGSVFASILLKDAGIFLGIFATIFLFWRASLHELFTNEQIFDVLFTGIFGGLILGRIAGFAININSYGPSIYRLLFFHVFPAFNFWGFIFGALVAVSIFLRHKKVSVFGFFDLAAGPMIFGFFVFFLFSAIADYVKGKHFDTSTITFTITYFMLFFILQRLASLKRHAGFFFCYFLTFVSLFNLLYFLIFRSKNAVGISVIYENALSAAVLLFGIALWYRLGRRYVKKDVKFIAGFVFLKTIGFFRTIRSASEAGNVSKSFIFAPYTIIRGFLVLLRGLVREIKLGVGEFLYTLGLKHLK